MEPEQKMQFSLNTDTRLTRRSGSIDRAEFEMVWNLVRISVRYEVGER